jgi:hypothetical protein
MARLNQGICKTFWLLSIASTVFTCLPSFGCDQHPGIPHDAWVKWVNEMNVAKEAENQAAKGVTAKAEAATPPVQRIRTRSESRLPTATPAGDDGGLPASRARSINTGLRSMDELGK